MHGLRMMIEMMMMVRRGRRTTTMKMIMMMVKMMMMRRRRRTTTTMIMIFLLSAIRARLHGCIDIGRQNEKDRLLDPATNLFRLKLRLETHF